MYVIYNALRGVDPDSLLISILHLIRLLLILKVSLPNQVEKRQRVADTKAKIGRGEGRTNPIRCEGDPSRRKYTSNGDEGHMVHPRSSKSWEAKLQILPVAEMQWAMASRRLGGFIGLSRVVGLILQDLTHNTILLASLSLF